MKRRELRAALEADLDALRSPPAPLGDLGPLEDVPPHDCPRTLDTAKPFKPGTRCEWCGYVVPLEDEPADDEREQLEELGASVAAYAAWQASAPREPERDPDTTPPHPERSRS